MVRKISVILAHDVLDALLLRIGIEINNGPLANFLNMTFFPVFEKGIRSHAIFILLPGVCMDTGQRVASGAKGTDAPARLSGAPQ